MVFRWKDSIAEAVLECASLGKVPDYPVPVDEAIMESLPQLAVSKVTTVSRLLVLGKGLNKEIIYLSTFCG